MTKREMKHFEKLLLAHRDRLTNGLRTLAADTLYQPSTSGNVHDPANCAEVGTESNQIETAMSLVGSESEMLYEIEEALKRIQEGTYGICEGTGDPIPKARLEVFPAARYCVQYQEKIEKGEV